MCLFTVKVTGSDDKVGIFEARTKENLCNVYFVVTSGNFDSEKAHEDDIFERQDILHFFLIEPKDYEYVKSQNVI